MANPSTSERGTPGGVRQAYSPSGAGVYEADPLERTWELKFPHSVAVYDRMRSEESHIGSVLKAIKLALKQAPWSLNDAGVNPRVAAFVRSELGLVAAGEARARRRRQGISFLSHVDQVCHMLWAGFMVFEQVYEIGAPLPDQEGFGRDVVHLRKLAPRLPRTIQRITVHRDGGIRHVEQKALNGNTLEPIRLGVDQVVVYSLDMEGADWYGRSLLRTSYKNWLIKDAMVRLDAQAAERNSMGVPEVTYDPQQEGQRALAEKLVREFRAGQSAGVPLPEGMTFNLKGVQGSTVDLVERMKYHDQEMGRAALAMHLDLGHDRGSQSLGETFRDVFMDGVQAVADTIAETMTEHVVRDLVEWNFGADEPYPTITPGDLKASQGIGFESMKTLTDAGILRPDDELEDYVRTRGGLPERDTETVRVPVEPVATEGSTVQASQPALSGLDEMLADLIEDHHKARGR